MRPDRIVAAEVRRHRAARTGENTEALSLPSARYTATALAAKHSAHGFHPNNVIAKRLGISAGDETLWPD